MHEAGGAAILAGDAGDARKRVKRSHATPANKHHHSITTYSMHGLAAGSSVHHTRAPCAPPPCHHHRRTCKLAPRHHHLLHAHVVDDRLLREVDLRQRLARHEQRRILHHRVADGLRYKGHGAAGCGVRCRGGVGVPRTWCLRAAGCVRGHTGPSHHTLDETALAHPCWARQGLCIKCQPARGCWTAMRWPAVRPRAGGWRAAACICTYAPAQPHMPKGSSSEPQGSSEPQFSSEPQAAQICRAAHTHAP